MSRLTYTKAIDDVLRPLGFGRAGKVWTRVRGDMHEQIDLQKSWITGGVTVNVGAKDLRTEEILREIPCEKPHSPPFVSARIGQLIDGYSRWWVNEPNGPAELAEAVKTYAVTWLDRVRTPEEQANSWFGRHSRPPWRGPHLDALAVTLVRIGAIEEALALFDHPVPKTAIPSLVIRGRCAQRWVQQQAKAGVGAAGSANQ